MLGLLLDKLAAAERRLRIDKLIRTESSATFLALVAISTLRATSWTCTGDITVGKECLCLLIIILLADLLNELCSDLCLS